MGVSNSSTLGRPDLAVLLEEFDLKMDREGFIGLKVMPRFDSAVAAAQVEKIKLAQLLKNHDTARNSDGTFKKADWEFEPWYFNTKENALEGRIDRQKAKIFARYFDAEAVTLSMTQDAIMRQQEKRIASLLFNTTTYTGSSLTAAASTSWATWATSTCIADVDNAIRKVYANSGLWPDTLVVSKSLYLHLIQNQSIVDRVKYVKNPNLIDTSDLAQAFKLRQVLVAGGSKNTADEGQSAAPAQIWDKTMAFVCKVPERIDNPWDPGIGRTFYFTGNADENAVETYYDQGRDSDIVRVRHSTDELLMYKEAGFLITGCAS